MISIHQDPEPDPFEKRVRFVSGLLGGAVLGFIIFLEAGGDIAHPLLPIGISAAVCSILAVRYGDAFWKFVLRSLGGL